MTVAGCTAAGQVAAHDQHMGRAGQASVDVVADVTQFAGQFVRDLNAALAKAGGRLNVESVSTRLSQGVQEGVAGAEKALASLPDAAERNLTSVGQAAAQAGAAIEGEITDSVRKTKTVLGEVDEAARRAGAGIGDGVSAGTDRAKESLGGLGEQARRSADETSKAFDKVSAGMALAGAAGAAAFTAAATAGIEKGRLDALVVAQIGATPDEAAKIGQLSGSLYAAGFGRDLPEVQTALRSAMQSGLADVSKMTDDTVRQVTGRLITVSQVLEEDTSRVSAAVSQMLRTGLADSAEQAMDLLVAATQRGVNKSEDLVDAVNEYGTQFRQLGLDGPRAFGLLSQAIQAGARDADTAADAIKEFAIRAIDGTTAAAEGYKLLGLDAEKMTAQIAKGGDNASKGLDIVLDRLKAMKNPVDQNAAAVALFGTKAEDLGQALFAMDLDTAAKEMQGMAGAAERAGDTLANSAGANLDKFIRQVQVGLIEKMGQAAVHVQNNATAYKALGAVLGGLALTVGVVSAATKVWATAQTVAAVATKAWAAANRILSASFFTSPIGIVIGLVALLVGGLILAYQKSDTFRAIVDSAMRAVGDAAIWMWNSAIKPAFEGIKVAIQAVGDAAVWLWGNVLQPTLTSIGNAAMWLWSNAISPTFTAIKAVIDVVGAAIGWLYSVFAPPIIAIGSLVWTMYSSMFKVAFAGIMGLIEMVASGIGWLWSSIVSPIFGLIGSLAMWLWTNVIAPNFAAIESAVRTVGAVMSWLWTAMIKPNLESAGRLVMSLWTNYVSPAFGSIASFVRARINEMIAAARNLKQFVETVSSNFTGAVNAARSRIDSMVSTVKGLPGRIKSALGDLGGLLYQAGKNLISGLIRGIEEMAGRLLSKVHSLASSIRNAFPFSPAKEGPLSGRGDLRIAGGKVAAMVAEGMESRVGVVRRAAATMATAVQLPSSSSGGLDVFGQRALASVPARPGSGAGGTTVTFGPGSINVTFSGVVPTEEEARATGRAVGDGIGQALARRDIRTQVRTL